MRFLNVRKSVESKEQFNFLTQFKDILAQLSFVSAGKELVFHTQAFFHAAFKIPLTQTRLYIRNVSIEDSRSYSSKDLEIISHVEQFLTKQEYTSILEETQYIENIH